MFMKSAAALDMISALGFTDFRELEAMVVGVSVSRLTVAARIQLRRVPNLQEERKRESCSHFLFRIRGKNRRRKQPIDDGLLEFPILRLSRLFACAPTFRKTAARKTGSPSKATADASALPFASARPPDSKQVRALPELCYARNRPRATRRRAFPRSRDAHRPPCRPLSCPRVSDCGAPSGHEKTDPNIAIGTARGDAKVPETRIGARDVRKGDSRRPRAFPPRSAP